MIVKWKSDQDLPVKSDQDLIVKSDWDLLMNERYMSLTNNSPNSNKLRIQYPDANIIVHVTNIIVHVTNNYSFSKSNNYSFRK